MTKLYHELAGWYQLLTPVHEYLDEAELYHQVFQEKLHPAPQTILELGCGAGHVAYYLKQWYNITLSDISESMLGISKKMNPECAHFLGDMRNIRLNQTFDVVNIHDAIMYMISEDDLKQTVQTAFVHCRPGGMVLISPDYVKETFKPVTDHGGSDGEGRGLRYLEWTQNPDPDDCTYTVDYAYLMKDADGSIRVEHDHHVEGLFNEATWLRLLKEAGFDPYALSDSFERINFLGYKPLEEIPLIALKKG